MGRRYFAFISGIFYVLLGILGFIPSFVAIPTTAPKLVIDTGYGFLLGLFPVNILHNIVHLAVGICGIAVYNSYSGARIYARCITIFYGLLAVMGLLPVLNTTLGFMPLFGNDIWLHGITALIAIYFGFMIREPIMLRRKHRQYISTRY